MKITLHAHPTIPGLFLTRDGRVFRELPPSKGSGGYHTLKIDGDTIRRHTLIAETFVGPRPPGCGVRHLDGDPANDSPRNLAWGPQAANMQDMVRHGRSTRGVRNPGHKMKEHEAREIKQRRAAGESGKSLAEEFGVNQQTVCDIHKGRTWSWLK